MSVVSAGSDEQTVLEYVVYDGESGQPESSILALIAAYDPDDELILQFAQRESKVRTLRVRTAPGGPPPRRVWFFEMLRRVAECPDQVELPLPEWFESALFALTNARKV